MLGDKRYFTAQSHLSVIPAKAGTEGLLTMQS